MRRGSSILLPAVFLLAALVAAAQLGRPRLTARSLGLSFDPAEPGLRVELRRHGGGTVQLADPAARVSCKAGDTWSCHLWYLDWQDRFGTESAGEVVVPPRLLPGGARIGIIYQGQPSEFVEELAFRFNMDLPAGRIAWVKNYTPPRVEDLEKLEGLAAALTRK